MWFCVHMVMFKTAPACFNDTRKSTLFYEWETDKHTKSFSVRKTFTVKLFTARDRQNTSYTNISLYKGTLTSIPKDNSQTSRDCRITE